MSQELKGSLTPSGVLVGQLNQPGGGGTDNYNDLVNKPSINGITLVGNKSTTDLHINIPTKVSQLQNDSHFVQQSAIPTKTSQLQNDSGFAYAANLATVALTGSYNNLTDKPTIPAAQVNSDWNSNSGVSQILNKPNLAAVATSGSYDDLTDKPTIPAAQVNSDWNSNSGVSQILNKPNLAAVATSGSYDDLTDKPTIPAAQVNSDWNSNSGVSQILNKPTIPTNADFSLSGLSDTTITNPSSGQVLSYDNEGNVVNENLANIYSNTTVGSISLYKFGPIICCVIGGSWETDSNGRLIIDGVYTLIPTAYRPSDAINEWDTNNDTRMYINTAGVITIPAKVSQTNLAIRASFTWFRAT